MLTLAKGPDIQTTAEGVESTEQFEYPRAAGVDFVQGYLIAAPHSLPGFDSRRANWPTENVA